MVMMYSFNPEICVTPVGVTSSTSDHVNVGLSTFEIARGPSSVGFAGSVESRLKVRPATVPDRFPARSEICRAGST